MASKPITREEALFELAVRRARKDLLAFMRLVWWMPQDFIIGRHTRAICDRLTKAVEDYEAGVSTKLIVDCPPRHGKSDIISLAFPAWFLGREAALEPSVMEVSYSAEKAEEFSLKVRDSIIRKPIYRRIFPGVRLSDTKSAVASWKIEGSAGTYKALGIHGGATGSDADLEIIDDPIKDESESRSPAKRKSIHQQFATSFNTRLSPVSIQIVMNTRWHVADLTGFIMQKMQDEPGFSRYDHISFPARKDGPDGYEYLFPERFPASWYDNQRATMTKQMAAAMLDCAPVVEGGNRFVIGKIAYHDNLEGWPISRDVRGWDLASSSDERNPDDPDWTVGVRGQVVTEKLDNPEAVATLGRGAELHHVWIRNIVACREEAPARDKLMRSTAIEDGPSVQQHVEAFGAYKDTYTTMQHVLRGISTVHPSRLPGDKSAKSADLEPCFEAGIVHIYRPGCARWLDLWIRHFVEFPNGEHDDFVDATAVMYHASLSGHASVGRVVNRGYQSRNRGAFL